MYNHHFGILIALIILLNGCQQEPSSESPTSGTGDSAIDGLTAAINESPNKTSLYIERATLFYNKENYEDALKDLDAALNIDSTNVQYLHLLADVQLDYYQSFEALKTMDKVLRLYPGRIPSLLKMSEFQYLLKKHEASIATTNTILKKDPQNAEAYFMMGLNYREMEAFENTVNVLQKAVELDPYIIDAWITLGQVHAEQGNPIARKYFDSALEIAPNNVEVMHAKAFYLMEQEALAESVQLFKAIAKIDPQYEVAHFNAGLLYLDLDSLDQAYDQFNITINIKPTHAKAYFYRGMTLKLMGQANAARQNFEQALRFDPNLKEAQLELDQLNPSD